MITSHLMCANFFMINLNVIITFMLQLFNNNRETMLHAEAVVQSCSVKKVFLEISQNSQENTCARISFLIKLQASAINTFFHGTPLVAASLHDRTIPSL